MKVLYFLLLKICGIKIFIVIFSRWYELLRTIHRIKKSSEKTAISSYIGLITTIDWS